MQSGPKLGQFVFVGVARHWLFVTKAAEDQCVGTDLESGSERTFKKLGNTWSEIDPTTGKKLDQAFECSLFELSEEEGRAFIARHTEKLWDTADEARKNLQRYTETLRIAQKTAQLSGA